MLNQPLATCVRILVVLSVVVAPVAAAEPQHPSLSELARKEAVRMATVAGGVFAGMLIGAGVSKAGRCDGDCELPGLLIFAPIGAIAGAVTGVLLAR